MHGFGLLEEGSTSYLGFFSKGRKQGQGIIVDQQGNKQVISEWKAGKMHGKAVFFKDKK